MQARLHLLRCLAREGDGENLRRLRAIQQQAHDARHQQPSLAAARAGFDNNAAFGVEGGLVSQFHSPFLHTPRISQCMHTASMPFAGSPAPPRMLPIACTRRSALSCASCAISCSGLMDFTSASSMLTNAASFAL